MGNQATTPGAVRLWPGPAPLARADGAEDIPTLTPYLPPGEDRTAAIVVCPGGGYTRRAEHEGEPVARWLCSLGIAGLVLDYRVAPYRWPVAWTDGRRAVRLTRARADAWRIDPRRVGILGFSAGGHVAASVAVIEDGPEPEDPGEVDGFPARPDALVGCYPVITFGGHRHDGAMRALLGGEADASLQRALSVETRVTPAAPPTFLWHTADDPAVPAENSILLAEALRTCGVEVELHIFASGSHGLGLAEEHPVCRRWTALCAGWLGHVGFTGSGAGLP
jgi:acetyl esterase/lipase